MCANRADSEPERTFVSIKGVLHRAHIRHTYDDGFSLTVPCLWKRYGKKQGLWAATRQVITAPADTPCCWKCERLDR